MSNINTTSCVLVCASCKASYQRLLQTGAIIAEESGLQLQVLSILPKGPVDPSKSEFMQSLYDAAAISGAQVTFLFSNEPSLTAAVHATKIGARHIVTGTPDANSNLFLETARALLPELPVSIVDADNRVYTFPPTKIPALVRI